MSSAGADEKNTKEQLLTKLLDGVKGCQSRFGSRTELATEDDNSIRNLCLAFEDVFLHGVRGQQQEKSKGLWQMTENLVSHPCKDNKYSIDDVITEMSLYYYLFLPQVSSGLRLSTEPASFWPLIKSQLSKHEAERFLLLQYVRSDFGRARAWLRATLNEHSLERYILIILSLDNLNTYYESWAFLRDPELSAILPQTAAGLGSVLFALVVDNPTLDSSVRSSGQVCTVQAILVICGT
jgi:sorting nexin-29